MIYRRLKLRDAKSVVTARDAIIAAGATVKLVATGLGVKIPMGKLTLEVDASLENSPSVLFDAVVLPDGEKGVNALLRDGRTMEFVKDQYRHCKTLLALGASSAILAKAGINATLPSGDADPGVIMALDDEGSSGVDAFLTAMAAHRHTARDQDPPLI